MKPSSIQWDEEFDVVVVGSGASGSAAAIFAHEAAPSRVVILEKGPIAGGTTAKSGGQYWIPNNHFLRERGIVDSREDFLRYVARYSFPGEYNGHLPNLGISPAVHAQMEAFYDNAADTISALEKLGALKSRLFSMSPDDDRGTYDYFSEAPENTRKWGRTLCPDTPNGPGAGAALIDQLAQALRQRDIPVRLKHAVVEVVTREGAVIGVIAETDSGHVRIRAKRGVIFASGGYTQDRKKLNAYQQSPVFGGCAVPSATGDVIGIAESCGAKMANLSGAWRAQAVIDHSIMYASLPEDVFWPPVDSGFFVNKYGSRCVNELANYHDRARSMCRWDPNTAEYPDLLHFYIYDQRAADLYSGVYPLPLANDHRASWILRGQTMADLAAAIEKRVTGFSRVTGGMRLANDFAERLQKTVREFNAMAVAGEDTLFRRGATEAEQHIRRHFIPPLTKFINGNDISNSYPNSAMHPLSDTGPYYAMILVPAVLDTNGGPVTDTSGRVLNNADEPIPGLYAVGNCCASPARNAYWGAGVTIGLGLVFGMLAGRDAARAIPRN